MPKPTPASPTPAAPVGGTFLSVHGYAILKRGNEALVDELTAQLTVKPRVNPNAPGAELVEAFPVYAESTKKLYMPRAFGYERFGAPTRGALPEGDDATTLAFHGRMRPEQEPIVEAYMAAARDPLRGGGIICLQCAGGKTVLSLYLASLLGKKTLVVCHKEFLMNQWRERIAQFLPTAAVGLIKQKKVDVRGKDIVIASLQSLAMREYDAEMLASFGLVVYDEAHHLGAEVFSRAMAKTPARYTLGLSATLARKDGLSKVIEWHLGRPVYVAGKRADTGLEVHLYHYRPSAHERLGTAYGVEQRMWNGKANAAKMVTDLCEFAPRNRFLVERLTELLARDPDRQTMVLSDRRGHLAALERLLQKANLGTIGYYVGGMKEADLKESEGKQIVLATSMMAAEALDIPTLNTLVLATPIANLEQAVGRIQRQKPEERVYTPTVIDVIDTYSIFFGQGRRRTAFYQKSGYVILPDGAPAASCAPDLEPAEGTPAAGALDFVSDDEDAEEA